MANFFILIIYIDNKNNVFVCPILAVSLKMQKNSSGLGVVTCDVQEGQEVYTRCRCVTSG